MLRSTCLGLSPLALGLSVGLHAAVFVASARRPDLSNAAAETVIGVDLLPTDRPPPIAPDVDETLAAPTDPLVNGPTRHSNMDSRGHHEPKRARPPTGPAASSNVAAEDMPRFSIAIGGAADAPEGVMPPSTAAREREGTATVVAEDAVDVRARLDRGLPPAYPPGARDDGVQGDVVVELVVGVSGAVESARVAGGVGHGLDEAALRAASEFRFKPASKGGRPVRVRMLWPIRFRLE